MHNRLYFVFSYFNATYISNASGLPLQTHRALEGFHRHSQENFINTPTVKTNNHKTMSAFGTVGENPHFNQALQDALEREKSRINGFFSITGRSGSSANQNELVERLGHMYANALADQYNRDVLMRIQTAAQTTTMKDKDLEMLKTIASGGMIGEGSYFSQKLREGLNHVQTDIIKSSSSENSHYNSVYTHAMANQYNHDINHMLLANAVLEKYNQYQLNETNRALQRQSNTATNALQNAFAPAIAKDKNNASAITNREVTLQLKSYKDLLAKIDAASKTATKTESGIQLANDKETTALSQALISSKAKTESLTPQITSYLTMPHALLATGIADIHNQNILLDNMQITMFEPKDNKETGFFFSTYGERMTLSSNPPSPPHSTGADIRYAALQAGLTLIALKNQNTSTNFGLLGTYGKLAFTPKNTQSSQKNTLDKWSLTAYGNIQHDSGVYASTLLSYGIFKEDIATALTQNSKKVSGIKTLGASATIGQKVPIIVKRIILEPQAQLSYQRLMLGILSNAENFKVNMGHPYQWLLRIGGRLTQNKGHAVSFYGKLNIINTFGKNSTLQIGKKSFQFSPLQTCLEGGLGVNANLSPNINLHGDISYQHKLKKVGISGIHLSGGMRYRF